MGYRTRFNRLYKQPASSHNSRAHISQLTRIPLSKLDAVYDRVLRYPALTGYDDLEIRIPIGTYATAMVYKYAIEHRGRGS